MNITLLRDVIEVRIFVAVKDDCSGEISPLSIKVQKRSKRSREEICICFDWTSRNLDAIPALPTRCVAKVISEVLKNLNYTNESCYPCTKDYFKVHFEYPTDNPPEIYKHFSFAEDIRTKIVNAIEKVLKGEEQ